MLSPLYAKLIGGGVALLIVAGLFLGLKHYKSIAEDRGAKLTTICQATRDASGQPKLACGEVPAQIKFMGQAVTSLSNALATQNAAVKAMGAETARQQSSAAMALKSATRRADAAMEASERLATSATHSAPERSCEPSKALEGAWK